MDGYVPKPIAVGKLFEVIDELVPELESDGRAAAAPTTGGPVEVPVPPPHRAVDREEMMACVGGDEELFRELVELFVDDYPGHLARIREAASGADAKELERAAHTLKGAVGNFAAVEAAKTALDLENMGRSGDLDGALERCTVLEEQLVTLCEELASI